MGVAKITEIIQQFNREKMAVDEFNRARTEAAARVLDLVKDNATESASYKLTLATNPEARDINTVSINLYDDRYDLSHILLERGYSKELSRRIILDSYLKFLGNIDELDKLSFEQIYDSVSDFARNDIVFYEWLEQTYQPDVNI